MSAYRFHEKRITLIVVAALALISFVALGSYAMRNAPDQESAERQAKETAERKKEGVEYRNKEVSELEQALERETDPEKRAKLEARLREFNRGYTIGIKEARRFDEFRGAGLAAVKWAKVPMDQAIQVAVSQNPGTVLQCELLGEREDKVVYHVTIISGDDTNWAIAHVFVNAIDGTIVKTEKELPRKPKPE